MKIIIFFILYAFAYTDLKGQGINIPDTDPGAHATGVPNPVVAYPSSVKINYVRSLQPLKPLPDPSLVNITSDAKEVQIETQYLDGLGRPLQNVKKSITPQLKDVVTPFVYDKFSRETYKYLSYVSRESNGKFRLDPFTEQEVFMSQHFAALGEQFFYSTNVYDGSPLNRVNKTMAAGNSWSGSDRGIEMKYLVNTVADDVKMWMVSDVAGNFGNYTMTGAYREGELFKNITIDENGKQVIEFKDRQGNVILKKVQVAGVTDNGSGCGYQGWLSTYYIYDDLDNLRCIIQPNGVGILIDNGWQLTGELLAEQCFRYEYDGRKRMITKKNPGAAEIFLLYDNMNRQVFMQDGNMRSKNWWMTSLYDGMNRIVVTGICIATRQQLQDRLNAETFGQSGIAIQGGTSIPDLVVNNFIAGTLQYHASSSITFNAGFESGNNSEFIAEIVAMPVSSSQIQVRGNPLPPGATFTALTISFFESYSFTSKQYNPSDISKVDAGNNLYAENIPTTPSLKIKGMATGSKIWVMEDAANINSGHWTESVFFYDDKSRTVQVQSDNFRGGNDVLVNRFDFTGKTISNYKVQNYPGTAALRIKTNYEFDHAGRLLSIKKQVNDDPSTLKKVAGNEFNELGQLAEKKLGEQPDNVSIPLESLKYDYNIRGWIKGINKDFALNTNNSNYFGQAFSYDAGFTKKQYSGNISGWQWRSKGDGEQRAYGFGYDAVNRLLGADFTQNNSGWNNSAGVDFTVSNLSYDANGNIRSMDQKGLKINSSAFIDQLAYTYFQSSNKLSQVVDASNDFKSTLGDFKYDAAAKNMADYSYDLNGNMVVDKNKDITISYNHLNLPVVVMVKNRGVITWMYDATGKKLQKSVVDNTVNPSTTTITSYVDGSVFENDILLYTMHEEGRIRVKPGAAGFAFDYFIRDHLGNVRMVLTDEKRQDIYPAATMETVKASTEENYYDIKLSQVVDKLSSIPDYPNNNGIPNPIANPSFDNANSAKLYRLNSNVQRTGLGIVLKVMSGDRLDIFGKSFYAQPNSGGNNANSNLTALEIINGLLLTPGARNSVKGTANDILGNTTGTAVPLGSFLNNNSVTEQTTPRAFIVYILFDEQFKFVKGGVSPVSSIESASKLKDHFPELQNIAVTKNGYIYVYCSNESPVDVYFDNLQVVHTRGPILEETHYYPFGLVMAGISSKAAGMVENKLKYTGKELQSKEFGDGNGLELEDFGARMLDPQIGRWHVIDALSENYEGISPYSYSLNDPINAVDPDGNLIIFVGGLMIDQYLGRDNNKLIQKGRSLDNPELMPNPNYKPYPGERTFSENSPTYLNKPFCYCWGNEIINGVGNPQKGIGGVFSQAYNDYNTRFISASSWPNSSSAERFNEGIKAGEDLVKELESKKIELGENETIKIIGHSQGAAFAAGMVSILAKHEKFSSKLEVVHYLSPHQPNGFSTEPNIDAHQWSTKSDGLSSRNSFFDWLKGKSRYQKINGLQNSKFHQRDKYEGDYGGHSVGTWIMDITRYLRSIGKKVTIIN
jgi:RHS repeat-associated protein